MDKLEEIKRLSQIKSLRTIHIKNSIFGNIIFPNTINNARQMLWHIINDTMEIPKCPICSNDLSWHPDKRDYRKFCSNSCSAYGTAEISRKTSVEKYGVDHYSKTDEFKKSVKKTSIEKYGVDHYSKTDEFNKRTINTNKKKLGVSYPAQCDSIIKKMKSSNIEKYGVDVYSKTPEFKEKFKLSSIEKYGTTHPMHLVEIKEKVKDTNIKKYGEEYPLQNNNILNKSIQTKRKNYYSQDVLQKLDNPEWLKNEHKTKTIFQISKELGVSSSNLGKYFEKYGIEINYINSQSSYSELEIINFIKELGVTNIDTNNRSIISPKEIDIYLKDYNIAIEYNGVYWHSENQGKTKNYHLNKTLECESKQIQLLHIFENEWNDPIKNQIWKSMIKSRLGLSKKIFARKCIFSSISTKEAKSFLNENHLEGFVGGTHKYGLFHNNELVQCMILSKSRFNSNYDYELIRLATKKDFLVVGGISKLLHNIPITGSLITYANRRFSVGNSYSSLGMKPQKSSPPNFYYTKPNSMMLESRQKYQKHKLKNILSIYNSNKTEWENMSENGYDRIWDCGNLVFTFEL
jgi:hypothetical protein